MSLKIYYGTLFTVLGGVLYACFYSIENASGWLIGCGMLSLGIGCVLTLMASDEINDRIKSLEDKIKELENKKNED